ncbi:MAG: hypothetical protein LUH19_09880 [Lachnospiraceae bacterium]|nr:hypothetical protein [Lachnospiraceae bacterium]
MICIFLLAANQNCGCCTDSRADTVSLKQRFGAGSLEDCGCCTADSDMVQNDCSCQVPQALMPGSSGDFTTVQYPFPPYPVLRE